jgi:hypothetical protein
MKGKAFVTALQIRQRAAFNIAFDDGETELTINDDDNVQGSDPGTGRSVDAGGCGWTLYKAGQKVAEGRDGRLGYANNFPYTDLAFEAPGRIKVVQEGPARGPDNGYYELRFNEASI